MVNQCKECGAYRVDKEISECGHFSICPNCGHRRPFKRLPLFILTGASGVGKSTIADRLQTICDAVVVMEGDMLWNEHYNTPQDDYREYRELWLRVCKNISQAGKPALFCGCAVPQQYENCVERRYFSNIYYLAVVAEEEILAQRLRARDDSGQDYIAHHAQFNRWLRDNCDKTQPAMTLLDNTHLSTDESAHRVMEWILQTLCSEGAAPNA